MKKLVLQILNDYLKLFPEEKERQKQFIEYLSSHSNNQLIDWNNFDGHMVASGIVYAEQENKFLVLYHKDLQMYLFPGGHSDNTDGTPLATALRETKEETGLSSLVELSISNNKLVPIDIDTHFIEYNKNRNLPEHYHFDFRYLFSIKKIIDIKIDEAESGDYKWVELDEINNPNYLTLIDKIKHIQTTKKPLM